MDNDYHRRLTDLYAGRDLSSELEGEMDAAALNDADLAVEMASLRGTVDLLREQASPFTEESYQRIRAVLLTRGSHFETAAPEPLHLQYQLPIQG